MQAELAWSVGLIQLSFGVRVWRIADARPQRPVAGLLRSVFDPNRIFVHAVRLSALTALAFSEIKDES